MAAATQLFPAPLAEEAEAEAQIVFGRRAEAAAAAAALLGAGACGGCWELRDVDKEPAQARRLLARDAKAAGIGSLKKREKEE